MNKSYNISITTGMFQSPKQPILLFICFSDKRSSKTRWKWEAYVTQMAALFIYPTFYYELFKLDSYFCGNKMALYTAHSSVLL